MGENGCICQGLDAGTHYELCPYRVRRLNAEFSEAEARGYAKAVEDAARVADAEKDNWVDRKALAACENIAMDIRALTPEPKKDGET